MLGLNDILNNSLVDISTNLDKIVFFVSLIIIPAIIMNAIFMSNAKKEFGYKKYDERSYYASKTRRNYLLKTLLCFFIMMCCKKQKYLYEIEIIYIFFVVLILIYHWKKCTLRIAHVACIKHCDDLESEDDENQIIGDEVKNKKELRCNKALSLTRRQIEHEQLKLNILKYLVSPAIITSFISFILNNNEIENSTFVLILLLMLLIFLWITYQDLNELQSELSLYEAALYNIKNRIVYTEEEKEEIERKKISWDSRMFYDLDYEDNVSRVFADWQEQNSD